jgi:hypothetical protein
VLFKERIWAILSFDLKILAFDLVFKAMFKLFILSLHKEKFFLGAQ